MTDQLQNYIQTASFTILGGVLSAAGGMILSEYNRKKAAKYEFKMTMGELAEEARQTRDRRAFYESTLPRFGRAIARVRPFLGRKSLTRMEKMWTMYQAINLRNLESQREADWIQDLYRTFNEPVPQRPSEIIETFISKFLDVAR